MTKGYPHKKPSLTKLHPDVARDWDHQKNGSLKPDVAIPPIADAEKVSKANSIKEKNLFFSIFTLYINS